MKRVLLILATLILSIGLVACSSTETEDKEVENVELSQDQDEEGVEDESVN